MTIYQAPQIEWQEPKNNEVIYDNNYQNDVICFWHNPINSYFIRKNPDEKSPKPFVVAYGGRELKEMASIANAKEWVEQTHYPSALVKAGFKPVSEPVSDIFDDILQWHKDACENPNYADEMVGRACMAEEFGEWCKSLTYFYEADILRKSAQDLYKSAEHIRATNYDERHFINRKAHLDSLVDLIWVAIQDGYRSGYDMKGALKELIRSNNSKRLPDGTFPRNEAGKIIKTSPTFTDVDLTEFI